MPGKNITKFAELLDGKGGLLRPTHYTVAITGGPMNVTDILAESVTIPGRSIATQERRTFGPQREMPYERLYSGDLDITFLFSNAIGGGSQVRKQLEDWMDKVIGQNDIINAEYKDYTGTIKITVENPDGSPQGEFEIEAMEVYPKTVSPVQLGYGMNDEYLRQSVSFAFRSYEITYSS